MSLKEGLYSAYTGWVGQGFWLHTVIFVLIKKSYMVLHYKLLFKNILINVFKYNSFPCNPMCYHLCV